jgi:pyroglutamyl-peptidase
MRALVTAFEAFGGARANASFAAVTRLPVRIGALDIVTAQLPTSYARSGAALIREIERVKPTFVLCVGEAGERHELNVERIAINVQDARLADNDGAQPIYVPVLKDAPAAYLATLPVRAIHDALIAAHLPATVSNSAGTFVCNHVF